LHDAARHAFAAAASAAAPGGADATFAAVMGGKLLWRDRDAPFAARALNALRAFAAARDACAPAPTKACGCDDVNAVYRLHCARLKVVAAASRGAPCAEALALAGTTAFAAAGDGASLAIVDDCAAAFRACRRDDPFFSGAVVVVVAGDDREACQIQVPRARRAAPRGRAPAGGAPPRRR